MMEITRQGVEDVAELIARQQISDVMLRYARGVDRQDWQSVRACFHDDAIDQHGDFSGTVDQLISSVAERHASIPFSMHLLGNCLIEFSDREHAIVETYFVAIQRHQAAAAEAAPGSADLEVFGRYCDRFERRNGVWKITARFVAYDSTRRQPSTHHLLELAGIFKPRDTSDPIFRIHRGELLNRC